MTDHPYTMTTFVYKMYYRTTEFAYVFALLLFIKKTCSIRCIYWGQSVQINYI